MPPCHTEVVSIRGQIAGGPAGSSGVLDKGRPWLSSWLSQTAGILGLRSCLLSSDLLPPDGCWVWFCNSRPQRTHSVILLLHSLFQLFSSLDEYIKLDLLFILPLSDKAQITSLLFFNLDIQAFSSMWCFHLISLIGSGFLAKILTVRSVCVCMHSCSMLGRWADALHSKTSLIQLSRDPQWGCTLIGASEPLI